MTATRREPNIAFRPQGLRPALERRGTRSGVIARRDLQRYYDLLSDELSTVRLTVDEARQVAGATEGLVRSCEQFGRGHRASELPAHRYLTAALAEVMGYGHELVEKLRTYDAAQIRAIIDALEQRLVAIDQGANDDDALYVTVGLVHIAPS